MKLTRVEFVDYKSVSGDDLDVEKDITCLVGINESGKSNILLALEKADHTQQLVAGEISRHSDRYGDASATPTLKLRFEVERQDHELLSQILGPKATELESIVLYKDGSVYRLDYPSLEYKELTHLLPNESPPEEGQQNEDDPESKLTEQHERHIREQVIAKLQEAMPRFLRFDSVDFNQYFLPGTGEVPIGDFVANPDAYRPVKNLLYLGGCTDFSCLHATDGDGRIRRQTILKKASKKINESILRLVWPIETVEIDLSAGDDILQITLKEAGRPHPFKPEERSRGLQWALAFNIYFLAETQQELSGSVLLIDEPGIFLHIDGQRKLLQETFPSIVKRNNQIIYTTHLPYLIDSRYPERIRILQREGESTKIGNTAWSEGEFGRIPEPVRTALGLDWANVLLFEPNNIIVEGPSDQVILRALAQSLGLELQETTFLPAYGGEKIPRVLAVAKVSRQNAVGLVDGDLDISKLRDDCKRVGIDGSLLKSVTEVAGAKNIVSVEDLIPEDVFVTAVFNAYKPLFRRRRNAKLVIDEIPTSLPRVTTLESFFAGKFRSGAHNLRKMDIARQVSKLLETKQADTSKQWQFSKTVLNRLLSTFSERLIAKEIDEALDEPSAS